MEIAPKLDDLPKLLGDKPYSLEDEEEETAAADDMDADGPGAASSSGCYTTEELLDRVQVWYSGEAVVSAGTYASAQLEQLHQCSALRLHCLSLRAFCIGK